MADVFEDTIGKVNHIDFVAKQGKDGNHFNVAYIHFDFWHDTIVTRNLQDRIFNEGQVARVVYDDPWYWVVLENKSKKFTTGERKVCLDIGGLKPTFVTTSRKACIDLGDFPALPSTRQPSTPPPTRVAMVCPHAPPRKAHPPSKAHTKSAPLYTNLADAFAAAARIQQEATTVSTADQDQDEIDDWIEQELAAEEDDIIAISNQYVCMLEQDNNQQRHIIDELMCQKQKLADELDDLKDEMREMWRKDGVESKYNEM